MTLLNWITHLSKTIDDPMTICCSQEALQVPDEELEVALSKVEHR